MMMWISFNKVFEKDDYYHFIGGYNIASFVKMCKHHKNNIFLLNIFSFSSELICKS